MTKQLHCKLRKFENTFILQCKKILKSRPVRHMGQNVSSNIYVIYLATTAMEKSVKDTEVKTDSTVMQSEVGNERKELTKKNI